MRSVRISVLALGLLTVLAPAASAAVTASVSGSVLTVTGDAGPNNIVVTVAGANLSIQGADIAGSGCAGSAPVTCPAAGIASITATLGNEPDRWDSTGINLPTTVDLGNGNAAPFPGQGARTGDGADVILGGPDAESDIAAGDGADTIRLFGGADGTFPGTFTGGAGSVLGGAGDDTIEMGDGNDGGNFPGAIIDGGLGNDIIDLGAGNDRNVFEPDFSPGGGNDTVLGGPGDDGTFALPLSPGIGDDTIDGGPGNDAGLIGGPGTDTIRGGADEDALVNDIDFASETIEGGSGDDTFTIADLGAGVGEAPFGDALSGGTGRDTVSAGGAPSSVSFTADGVANDGYDYAPRTTSIGPDVEVLIGGANNDTLGGGTGSSDLRGGKGNDLLTGGSGPNRLDGGDGTDTLAGGSADDVLLGGAGTDGLNGNDGNDMLTGGTGPDTIAGGGGRDTGDWSAALSPVFLTPGDGADDGELGEGDLLGADVENLIGGAFNDSMTGAPGPSMLSSGAGDDTITVTDGAADIVLCGAGDDGVGADSDDTVETTGTERCERVTKPPVVVTPEPLPTLGLVGKVDKKGRQKLQIACPASAAGGCSGDVRLVDKGEEPISKKAPFSVASGDTITVQVKLGDDALKTLKKKKKLAAQILADVAGADDTFRHDLQAVKLKG
ncbi:MAG: hypothetical protein QOI10_1780 [Solirubrobacterales bacterium]|jgi:Ca2+-binding RTX toxin-like protein|nr:hypothetical protein [Solirubrobacterales bacterium]